MTAQQKNLMGVDWSKIPAPVDDGGTRHLKGMRVPDIALPATDGTLVSLAGHKGTIVVFAYPRTGTPGQIRSRDPTTQSSAFRDLDADLRTAGATAIFGLSTQETAYQQELAGRLHLPFPVLSDEQLALTKALSLPTMQVAGLTLIRRLALVIRDGVIVKVFYPVFPPDRNAGDVLAWLKDNRA